MFDGFTVVNCLYLSAAFFSIGVLAGRPDLGMVCVAAWTVLSIGFHIVRVVQAAGERLHGRPVESWMAACEPAQRT